MRFLRIDDLKRHVRSVHKCDLAEEGGLKPREPKPGEAMHPSTSTHAGLPKIPGASIPIATTQSASPRTSGPRAPPIVIPPSVVPPPSWRPSNNGGGGSGGGGGGIPVPKVSRERVREREGRSAMQKGRPMSSGVPLSLRGETPPSPMDTREDD